MVAAVADDGKQKRMGSINFLFVLNLTAKWEF